MLGPVAVVALALAIGGCGTTHVRSQTGASTTTTAAIPARLRVDYTAHRKDPGSKQVWTLRCDPTGGNHPALAAACQELTKHPRLLLGSGRGQIRCMLVLANGPTVAVTGTVDGQAVRFSPSSACDPAWSKLRALLTGGEAVSR
jgi:hypothetical protein